VKKRKAKRTDSEDNDRALSETICSECGCGILDDEDRYQGGMSGSFGCTISHSHLSHTACFHALMGKVRNLENLVAKQALRLEILRNPEPSV